MTAKRISEKLEETVMDLAIEKMRAVLAGETPMTDVTHQAFKTVGDYGKVLGAENQRDMLSFAIEKHQQKKQIANN